MSNSITEPESSLSVKKVEDFLLLHPDFFVGRDNLLEQLKIPHKRGSALSLVERQLEIFRDRDAKLQDNLKLLISNGKNNDRNFTSIRKLTLSLLESRDIDQALEAVNDSLNHDFNIEFHKLILFSDQPKELPVRIESRDIAESVLGTILSDKTVFCGRLDEKQTRFLFGKNAEQIKYLAVAPLNFPECIGILVLGSSDKKQFKDKVGVLFISYIGDMLCRHFVHLIHLSNKKKLSSKKKK
ncbi:MAG: DUF484 family protein [Candidatus Endonucleobacter sp. (ex Gigantidas childressi)]|nr:DUF484 family protein [Candidatus Endonucleobacter sp. (ex Gigantidas childressi)]